METFVRNEGLEDHPFASVLERGELLLWVGRPDQPVYVRRGWQQFRVGIGLWCLLAASSAFSGFGYPADRFGESFCIFVLVLLPILCCGAVCYLKDSCRYAPWYALTDRHVFVALSDDGDFAIQRTSLSNVMDVYIQGVHARVGTVRCRCCCSVPTLLSKNLRLENVRDPERIQGLILEARLHEPEGQSSV